MIECLITQNSLAAYLLVFLFTVGRTHSLAAGSGNVNISYEMLRKLDPSLFTFLLFVVYSFRAHCDLVLIDIGRNSYRDTGKFVRKYLQSGKGNGISRCLTGANT